MPPLGSEQDLSDQQKRTLRRVREAWEAAEKQHRQLRPKWDVFYGLSRNYRRLQRSHAQANAPQDRDTVMEGFRRVFGGGELFVPYVFTVIETNVPRIMSGTPAVGVKPLDEDAIESCGRLKHLYERDAAKIDYETTFQEVIRSGLRYGLGVQKTYWEDQSRKRPKTKPKLLGRGSKTEYENVRVHSGPQAEAVDIWDFRWDPAAKSIATCSYVIHRTWRDMAYIKRQVEQGVWNELDLDKVKGLGSEDGYASVWSGRMQAAGISDYDAKGGSKHEVWEFHDGENVFTVLDRCLVVQEGRNPFHHCELPFQIYRPTLVEHEFAGIGEVEPLAHLQYELNLMRGQRRDAATLALNRGYFYQMGALDPSKIVTGAGVFNPVFGNPSEIVQPMPFTDPPSSGVSEEEALKRDIELTSGMSEAAIGSGGEETATGTQLVQAAANLRVRQKTKNANKQTVVPGARQWFAMYEQKITEEKQARDVRVDDKDSETGYSFIKVGPKDVQANVEIVSDESAMEADSPTQRRNDARELATVLAPYAELIEGSELVKYILKQHSIEAPDDWIRSAEEAQPSGPPPEAIVQVIGQSLQQAGVPDQITQAVLEEALSQLQSATSPQPEEKAAAESAPPVPAGG